MSADTDGVIDELHARRQRPKRQPPSRKVAKGTPAIPSIPTASQTDPQPASNPPATLLVDKNVDQAPVLLGIDEPTVHYGARVRRSLDSVAAIRIAEMKQIGIKTSKVELTETLLWEISHQNAKNLANQIQTFKNNPNHTNAPVKS